MQKYKRYIKDIVIRKKAVVIIEKYELTHYQWSLIKPLILPKTSTCGRARRDPRQLFNAIFWVLITDSPWCALPKHYGSWHTAYNNFRKWTKDGTIAKIFESFSPNTLKTTQIQIDSTYVKAHQHSSGSKKNKSSYWKVKSWTDYKNSCYYRG